MADPRDEMLREMAKHRGLRLVKSRRRKPGGDFGRYGLTDLKTGQDCFGIGRNGLEATADAIEDYLRGGARADWTRSLKSAGAAAKGTGPKRRRRDEPERPPKKAPKPETEPEPELVIRAAKAGDAAALAALLGAGETELRSNLRHLIRSGEAPVLAERGGILGCAAWHLMPTLQHGPVGRVTLLLVAADARRQGIGAQLLAAAEARLAERGAALIEAVSDIDLANAHGFFRRAGYARSSYRFAKPQTNN